MSNNNSEKIRKIETHNSNVSSYRDNCLKFYSYSAIDLSNYATKAAYKDITTYTFFNKLKFYKIAKTKYSINMIDSTLSDAEKKQLLNQIITAQQNLFENHFTSIYLLCVAFICLDSIFEKTPTPEILKYKQNVHDIALLYQESAELDTSIENSQSQSQNSTTQNVTLSQTAQTETGSFISREQSSLRIISSFNEIISAFEKYYTSAEFLKEASVSTVSTRELEGSAQLIKKTSVSTVSTRDLESSAQFLKTNPSKKIVDVIKIEDVPNFDFSQPAATLSKIADLVLNVINDSKSTLTTLDTALFPYDVYYTVFPLTESERKMNIIESKLDKFIDQAQDMSMLSVPIFSVISVFKLYTFKCDPDLNASIYSMQLMPGEKRELRQKSTQMTEEKRQKSSSIFDSLSQDSRQNLTTEINNEKERSNNSTATIENHINNKQKNNASVNVNVKFPEVDLGGFEAGTENSVDKDLTNNITNTREESNRLVENATQSHSLNVSSNRDVSVTENAESTTQTTQENSSVITFKNPNEASVLNFTFYSMNDVYFSVIVLSDIRILFSNGETHSEYSVEDLQMLLNKYVKTAYHPGLRVMVLSAGVVRDYKKREFNLITFNNNQIVMDRSHYSELCAENNFDIDDPDLENVSYVIRGIPQRFFYSRVLAEGKIAVEGKVGQPLLDKNEQNLMDQRIKIETAHALTDTARASLVQQKLDFNAKIFDQKIMDMENQDASQHYFLNFAEPSEYFNKTFILNMLNNIKKE